MQGILDHTKYWYLSNHKLFSQLSEESINDLCIISNYKQYSKHDTIDLSGKDRKRVYSIKEGTLKICCQNENGKEIILELLANGDLFGQIILSQELKKSSDEYAVVLSDELKLCSFETEKLKSVLEKNPELSIRYTDAVNDKLISFQSKYKDLIFKDAYTRVSDFFKRYAHYSGDVTSNRAEMRMMLTHQEIGDYTAISRQTVTDIINTLEAEGKIVYTDRKNVIIPDITKI
jgi:CRP/FNR family transcriptional regulator, cyclic AMP receptor protein